MAYPSYSLLRYGLQPNAAGNEIPLYMDAAEKINAVIGFATNADLFFIAGVSLNSYVTLSIGHYEAMEGAETFGCVANIHAGVNVANAMSAVFDSAAEWSKVYIKGIYTDKGETYIDLWPVNAAGILQADVHASAELRIRESCSEVLGGHVSTVTLNQQTFIANVTIPAHGRLVIDSNTFNMLLNGQNAIHLQKGDWIDLDRKIIYLDISTGTGGELSGAIIYRARYL